MTFIVVHTILHALLCAWTKSHINCLGNQGILFRWNLAAKRNLTVNIRAKGVCSIFVFNESLAGRRHASVREHRTSEDWAEEVKDFVDGRPDAEKIILIMGNLNTHTIASLYKRFPPSEAKRIKERLEIHYTPKHGNWLDMAEIELNVMTRQCLNRRLDSIELVRNEIAAWETAQNNAKRKIKWQFTTEDARTKLVSLYPIVG